MNPPSLSPDLLSRRKCLPRCRAADGTTAAAAPPRLTRMRRSHRAAAEREAESRPGRRAIQPSRPMTFPVRGRHLFKLMDEGAKAYLIRVTNDDMRARSYAETVSANARDMKAITRCWVSSARRSQTTTIT